MISDPVIFDIVPVPAARPRVTRWGTYYPKKYNEFRKGFTHLLEETELPPPRTMPCSLYLEFVCPRPAKPANDFPMGDIDNYIKSVLDSAQGKAWFADDKQIIHVQGFKRYAAKGEKPHIMMACDEWLDVEDALALAISMEALS
jgi:Holliday junction resolvase RusA-like endonuclease